MKNFTIVLGTFLSLFMIACEGPQGPPGFDGFDGLDGAQGPQGPPGEVGKVVEILGDFTTEGDFSIFYEFQEDGIEVLESDVVLVYLSFDQVEDNNGEPVEVWRLLPQTRILDQGLLQYNFDYTFFDVNIFMESDFDLATLPVGDTENQYFRIAVLPADFVQTSKLNTSNLGSVMSSLGISEDDVQTIKIK